MKRYISVFLCFVMVVIMCSCAGGGSVISDKENLLLGFSPSDSVTEYNFTSGEEIIPEDYDKFSTAATEFSLRLFEQNVSEEENVVVAPVSVLTTMSMLTNGAKNKTLSELRNTLAGGLDVTAINTHNHYLTSRLSAFNTEEGFYKEANSLWFNDAFDVRASFLQPVVNFYDAGVFRIPLTEEDAKDKINGWIAENTDGEITDAVEEINPKTVAMVINTVLLDDAWTTPYTESQISEGKFHGAKGDTDATYMTSNEFYLSTSYAEGFIKSFKNIPCKFAAILPPEGVSVSEFASSLTYNRLTALLESQQSLGFCRAKLPQFAFDTKFELSDSLKAMGISETFDKDKADFSLVSNTGNVYLTSVTQNAFIEIGAQGARAGAATVGHIAPSSAKPQETKDLVFDRPFLFVIYDNESNIPVFIGAVNNV